MLTKIVLSADIVAFTSLDEELRNQLIEYLNILIKSLEKDFGTYGRIIKGDYIEIVVENPVNALTIMLQVKSYIKSFSLNIENSKNNRLKNFKNYGVRIAMGYGKLDKYDKENGIIDGEAIYYSGRKLNEETKTYNKERIVIKNTLFFISENDSLNQNINTILGLIDILINNATAKQCQILYFRLLGLTEQEIAKELDTKQPTVNKQLTSIGWNAIEKSIKYFEQIMKQK
ncbi:fumarate hydratase [Flavobacterium sp.]|uniref:fumarate hydratase n=1 Tax=Flavobacterium sp. TaxID=239 RepID=UPI0035B39865